MFSWKCNWIIFTLSQKIIYYFNKSKPWIYSWIFLKYSFKMYSYNEEKGVHKSISGLWTMFLSVSNSKTNEHFLLLYYSRTFKIKAIFVSHQDIWLLMPRSISSDHMLWISRIWHTVDDWYPMSKSNNLAKIYLEMFRLNAKSFVSGDTTWMPLIAAVRLITETSSFNFEFRGSCFW